MKKIRQRWISSTPPSPQIELIDILLPIAASIVSMDLDIYNIPTNLGNNLTRYSEYTPKNERPDAPTVEIQTSTVGRAHGEIRPIKGMDQSWITRFSLDFTPNVVNKVANLPDLEIDGWSAVDPPAMTFDRSFTGKDDMVLSLEGGDFEYENPLQTKEALATPFGVAVEAPPDNHNYFMIRFKPEGTDLFSDLEEVGADAMGKIILWAFLPTLGITDPKHYEDLNIPYNTFPRRFDDLLRLFAPLMDAKQRKTQLQNAPYLNPNSEYLDEFGVRQPIPQDPQKVIEINEKRLGTDLPLVSRYRGGILDWTFLSLARDLDRLADLPDDKLPSLTFHLAMNPFNIPIPNGEIKIKDNLELKGKYWLHKVGDPAQGSIEAGLGLRLALKNLNLEGVPTVQFQGNSVGWKNFAAGELQMEVGDLLTLGKGKVLQDFRGSLLGQDLKAEGIAFEFPQMQLKGVAGKVEIGSVKIKRNEHGLRLLVEDLYIEDVFATQQIYGVNLNIEIYKAIMEGPLELDLTELILGKPQKKKP